MTAGGLTDLHIVPKGKTVDCEYYREVILKKMYFPPLKKDGMFPDPSKAIFQQDGATPHTAKVTQDLCDELFPIVWKKDDWPGSSPDLNPVEKLWSALKERVFETPYCKTIGQLTERVQRVWKALDNNKDYLASLVDGNWAERVSKVIDHQGENNFK